MIALAKDHQKEEMARLWQICFGDPTDYIRNFFSRRFDASRAVVYLAEGKVASMAFMLTAALRLNGGCEPVQYIYAVGTHPDYRKRGIMGRLMEAAWDQALKAGQRFSVLLPASDALYLYYGRMGYLEYFKRRRIQVCVCEGRRESSGYRLLDPAPGRIWRIRQSLFGEREGFVLWDEPAVAYAISALEVYGGRILCFEREGRLGYVMGYVDKARDTAVIQELAADPELWSLAVGVAADHFPAASVQLSLPGDVELSGDVGLPGDAGLPENVGAGLSGNISLPGDARRLDGWGTAAAGAVERWGMIRPLNGEAAGDLERSRARGGNNQAPYLGLALD
jgi:ribosomal protein S18 acetylase RimI-like enzyme